MRAWQVLSHGEPTAVLRLDDIDEPAPGRGEVLVAVEAAALNFADVLLCRGGYQEHPDLPFTPGLELAGTVVAAGDDAGHAVGDRVTGAPLLPRGSLAERCLATTTDVFALPAGVPATDAAALFVTYQTAWFALVHRAGLRAGETVLVHAAAGGAGSAAVQVALALGATIIATAGGPEKVERCRALGAHHALDHRADDVPAAVLDLTDGRGADVIFDPVGGETFTASTRCIAWEGRLLVIGAASGRYAEARTNHVLVKNYSVVGVHWGGYRTRDPGLVARAESELLGWYTEGRIRPEVSETMPLDGDVPGALERLAGGRTTGKLVVVGAT